MEFSIAIEPDKEGFTGRECPQCVKYFKIKFGTGLSGATDCHCPYCNHVGTQNEFWTKEQREYAKSIALHKISGDLLKSLKKVERKPDKKAFISIGITVKGRQTPIAYYTEKELEENISCNNCTLEYTISGAFGYCHDCGIHNSKQIVNANFDLVEKILDLASSAEGDIKAKLISNALEDAISAFDGFGRAHCSHLYQKISFQNAELAFDKLRKDHGVDIQIGLDNKQWEFIKEQFQKRHLLAHTMGIIDEDFILRTGQSVSLIGRKVQIAEGDVRELIAHLRVMVHNLFDGIVRT